MPIASVLQLGLALALNGIVVFSLARSHIRRFLLIFSYCLIQIVDILGGNILYFGLHSIRIYTRWVWTGEFVAHTLITLIILSLLRETLIGNKFRNPAISGLFILMVGLALVSLVMFHDPHQINRWLIPVSRNLSFGEEMLNLILWTLLLQRTDYDRPLVIVSCGIGLQVSGEVIGHTLRMFAPKAVRWAPDSVVFLCEILCLGMWIWAVRTKPEESKIHTTVRTAQI